MKILALVLAGGEGTRLHPLTAEHAKPALPFVNGYRIVDFVLSNLVNSGLTSIYVVAQYKPQSLIAHVESAWSRRIGRRRGFVRTVLPRPEIGPQGFRGTADAVYRNLDLIERHNPDLVAVFAADHVYRMDVGQMISFHQARSADVTVAAVPVPVELAGSFGIIVTGPGGKIREFQEKPARAITIPGDPTRAYASMGNYLFDTNVVIGLLHAAHRNGGTDFGRDILPRLAGRSRLFAYDFGTNYVPGVKDHEEAAYWRDVGTLAALSAAQGDIVGSQPRFDLTNALWPIHGASHPAPARGWTIRAARTRAAALRRSEVQPEEHGFAAG